ncbi:hypothetical protein [Fructobacillus tropaeoli]|uniref:Uncharacterized protein n=1 Tax=Fructobacillus tropaeoli TaxID=709323 RepID=A0A3F3HCA8_9LACO|nr:hypothetical protein [Fructobacillus tropaeoli]GAP05028.1 hypothetical protein FTRO_0240030 [Fructobacillus tropaeoli]
MPTTGNWVADGLDEHLSQEAELEQKQEKRNEILEKIDEIEEQMDYHMGAWDDLNCESHELQEELEQLDND